MIADNKLDGATALANADNFLTQGVDGVIEFQTDEKFGNVIMDKFRAKNIPVIAIDIPMPGATFFGADNYKAGLLAGEAAAKYANENWGGQVDAILLLELPQSGADPGRPDAGHAGRSAEQPEDQGRRRDGLPPGQQEHPGRVLQGRERHAAQDPERQTHRRRDHQRRHRASASIAALEAAGRKDQDIVVGQGADPSGQAEMMKEGSIYLGATGYFPEKYGEQDHPGHPGCLELQAAPALNLRRSRLSSAKTTCAASTLTQTPARRSSVNA